MPKARKEISVLENLVATGKKKFVRYEEGAALYSLGMQSTAETLFPDISINLLKLPSSQAIVSEKSFVASH